MTVTRLSAATAQATHTRDLIADMPFWETVPRAEVIDLIVHETRPMDFSDGQTITSQDDECEYIYYIRSGQVRLKRERPGPAPQGQGIGPSVEVMNRVVNAGYLVGRFALTYNMAHTSTATAEGDVSVLAFPTSAFERLIYRYPGLRGQLTPQAIINRLRTMPLLARVGLVSLSYLAEEVDKKPVKKGDIIYTHDQPADRLYLIERGQVEVSHPRHSNSARKLGTGNAFGFPGSIGGASQNGANEYGHWATATANTTLFSLPWERMEQLARRYPHVANPAIQDKCLEVIRAISVFDNLSPEQQQNLAGYCTFQHIPQHHLIMQQGDIGDSMWVLLEGSQAVLSALDKSGPLPPVPVDGLIYFGEPALIATRSVNSTIDSEPGSLWLRFHWRDFDSFVREEKDPTIREKLKIRLPDELKITGTEEEYRWLSTGEQLISLTRRHWLSLLQKMQVSLIGWTLMLAAVVGVNLAGISVWWAIWLLGVPSSLAMAWGVLDHLNDFFIVTNQRIIQQEKVILTSEYRREALLEQVQNVGVRTSFWGRFFGYGAVSIFTAGSSGSIDFDFVPNPTELQASIFRLTAERKARYRAESRLEIQTALEKRLGLAVDLPSRVLSGGPRSMTTDDRSLPWHKRLWRYLFADHQVQWSTTDRIVWHKHWFVLARQVVPMAIVALGLLVLMAGGFVFDFYQQVDQAISQTIFGLEFILAIVFLVLAGAIAWVVADWWNDTYELTNDRIIDIEKLPLFLSEERKEARLSEVQDVRLSISSPLEMILNYGDIIVQTAATDGAFTFDHVPNPRAVKEEINRRLIEWRRNDERNKARAQMQDLPDWFEMYRRLEAGMEPTRVVLDTDAPKGVKGLS
ncbi:MAG: cyclic nucleotide-binding domain-containing protein [Caldilineaceae bacterium]|nr:cyclic nucleotide-binding domain-containing protein [Caldilineaceae bacterium]